MSLTTTILAIIEAEPGLTDRELMARVGAVRVQPVNAVCRQLAATGAIQRLPGHDGKLVNVPGAIPLSTTGTALQSITPHEANPPPTDAQQDAREQVCALDPMRTVIVFPCSKCKWSGALPTGNRSITDVLPAALVTELQTARMHAAEKARLDTSALRPAWRRYKGVAYQSAETALEDAVQRQAHVIILSGGYGLVQATDPVGYYEAEMKKSWWPNSLIGRCLAAYAKQRGISALVAFTATSTHYAKVVKDGPWSDAGLDAYLIVPNSRGAQVGQRSVSQAIGEAFSAFWQRDLTPQWTSTHGLSVQVTPLS